jgi:uncharacterized membrane protein required for colicin V production
VTTVDWIIVAFAVLLAANGLRQGFIIGGLQLVGFVAGAFLGSRIGPALLSDGSHSPYAPLFALGGAVLLGGFCAAVLERAGAALKMAVPLPGLHMVDSALGAVLGGILALGLAWIVGSVLLQTPGLNLRRDIQRSQILRALNDVLPPSGPILNALARFDPLPQIEGPGVDDVPTPDSKIARDPDVQRAQGGVVKVLGTACGLGIEGSGWIAARNLVVTNAHVVAGEDDTVVQVRGTGPKLEAIPVLVDSRDDLAILRVEGLDTPAIPLAPGAPSGRPVAIMGFPNNGPFDVRPGRLGGTRDVLTQDAYGNGPIHRAVTSFRGLVRSGNSGGPLVDAQGRVAGTVFASTIGGRERGGYAVPVDTVRQRLAAAGNGRVSTGPCTR